MLTLRSVLLWSLCTYLSILGDLCLAQAPPRAPLTNEQREQFEKGLHELQAALNEVPLKASGPGFADAAIYAKGVEWALKYDHEFSPAEVELIKNALVEGRERIAEIPKKNKSAKPWLLEGLAYPSGKYSLGYVSKVDGSIQPYGVVVPRGYDSSRPIRLDVVLHGSQQPVGMSELKFMGRFDVPVDQQVAIDAPYIELHPLGRVENCYRWAGESDVHEAIENVCQRFNIDRARIVLRGMSMGASGTWHLGLKYPDHFVALGPYCGYVDTHRFSETPLPNFVKVGPLPVHQELGLHMLDSVDYAANASMVPAIACMGEKDIFFDAHVIMAAAMRQEGIQMVNLISPGTGHVIDPITQAEQLRLIKAFADRGIDHAARDIRFVTWTLKYSRCHWIQLLGLDEHYQRAEIVAKIEDDRIVVSSIKNINRFMIYTGEFAARPKSLAINGQSIAIPPTDIKEIDGVVVFTRVGDRWELTGEHSIEFEVPFDLRVKHPGLQGPIDDAFTRPFLCVQGTGEPWNAAANAYANASLARFADDWQRYFRGVLPLKKDTEVTDEDVKTKNLILFGDPGSNSWIAKIQGELPLTWTKENIEIGGKSFSASEHAPALIMPNPLPGAERNYCVLNTGHTFHGSELGKINYLLFPRWGDWAVLKCDADKAKENQASEEAVEAGYFNEQWLVKE